MFFRTPIEMPSSRHPYSEWDFYQHMTSSMWHGAPPKIDRVWHAKAHQRRSRASTRHAGRPVLKPGPWRGPPYRALSTSTSGWGPRINPMG